MTVAFLLHVSAVKVVSGGAMIGQGSGRIQRTSARLFPERRIHLSSDGSDRVVVLSTFTQASVAGLLLVLSLWAAGATAALMIQPMMQRRDEAAAVKIQRRYERLIADRQARLDNAVAKLSSGIGGMKGVAEEIAHRHAALAMLLTEMRGKGVAAAPLAPISADALKDKNPADALIAVQQDQVRLADAAEASARSRAERLRLALRLAGVDASAATASASTGSLGGPLIEAGDPRALAAVLDVDTDFATRIQHAAQNLSEADALSRRAERLPLAKPVADPVKTSGFGARIDPFTHRGAFHPGQDFAGGFMTPIQATAPGVVSFTGQRSGYGNVVEIDHGGGFKTRYAHLQAISVAMGQRVGVGQRIGAMGSTGRSTGVHLHYEVWENGRVQNPTRFLKAGDYVQQDDQ